jgi:death-on-curing protein
MRYLSLGVMVKYLTHVGFMVRDLGLLDAALSRPRTRLFGNDAYPTLEMKAASLMHSLVKNHALMDGNKRSSWFALNAFLLLNGFELDVTESEAFEFILSVATDRVDLEGMARWIAEHLTVAA